MKWPDFPQLKQVFAWFGGAGRWMPGAPGWVIWVGAAAGRMKTGYLSGYEGGRGKAWVGLKGRMTNLVRFLGPREDPSPPSRPNLFVFPCPGFFASTNIAVLTTLLKVRSKHATIFLYNLSLKPLIKQFFFFRSVLTWSMAYWDKWLNFARYCITVSLPCFSWTNSSNFIWRTPSGI